MGDVTPPPLQGPSSKEKKYDRQLRLWAASGQAALEEAHVLLVNSGCGVVGVETLKNLVLPGVGNFTIVDPESVTDADLGVNFFLDESSLGGSRAKVCCELLQELNPDVRGNYIAEPIETCLNKPDFLRPYTLIVLISPIALPVLNRISHYAQEHHVPLVYIHSVGFYSHLSLALPPAFPIVETHPDPSSTIDLRLLAPWPELTALAREMTENLESLSDHQHGHVPFVLLLLHYLDLWRAEHDGRAPESYKEKSNFREMVRRGARTASAEGEEENYEEAVGAVLKSLNPPTTSSAVKEMFEASECTSLSEKSANFWIIAHVIFDFWKENSSLLPLPGSLPDMKAQSTDYIKLQNVYKAKARKDFRDVLDKVRRIEKGLNRETRPIDEKEVEAFCKGAGHIKLVKGRPLHTAPMNAEKFQWGDGAKAAYQALQNPDSLLPLYIGFLAYDTFIGASAAQNKTAPLEGVTATSAAPGQTDSALEADKQTLLKHAFAILEGLWKENGKDFASEDVSAVKGRIEEVVGEITRAGGSELHNISSLTGGMAAQEIIKLITKQYVPVDNTCLFDGITSRSEMVRL